MLWPKQAGKFIAERAKDVIIKQEGVDNCAKSIANAALHGQLSMESFKQNEVLPLQFGLTRDQLINWTFLVDALNFNFWTEEGEKKFTVTHDGKKRTGYLAMVNAINRAIAEGKPIYDPNFYSKLNEGEIKNIFRSDNEVSIPLLDKRIEILKEVGYHLLKNFEGNFRFVVDKAEKSAIKLIEIVTKEFPCFNDVHTYNGQRVAIFKRVQILAADLAMIFADDKSFFQDLQELTMFADYRVPQSLVHFGVISYSDELMKKLKNNHLFTCGDKEEVELRGVSIHAVELIVESARKILSTTADFDMTAVNSATVDYFLWDFRQKNANELSKIPFHKTRCIYY